MELVILVAVSFAIFLKLEAVFIKVLAAVFAAFWVLTAMFAAIFAATFGDFSAFIAMTSKSSVVNNKIEQYYLAFR
jgi:hypothetical protein